ncbi:glycosyltransferase family 4 protein [Flavobacterium humi]|uniref:Glycosyltransferase family 1 protein n=1 Tax=Flavobacterium humi TaxID=2562683 RepID=A0A4Z0L6J0_9FLAO|nr:glycosyltransferase [Flavobacterium humi]TGD57171.1 glycosyltransferase family 1 protein [Flavobacterium humi]
MKNLLYIGNKLSSHGLNKTTIETLGPLLEQEGYAVTYASSKKSLPLRLLDMLLAVARGSTSDYVLIDTYSTSSFWYAFATAQLCRLLRMRYIPILHGGNLPDRLAKNPSLCKMLFGNAYRNVAPSGYLFEAFKAEGYANLAFIPNVLQLEEYPCKDRPSIQPKILWVRAFASIYNPKMAVDVLHRLQQKYQDASLCMVGPDKDGSLAETRNYADEIGVVSVTFTGKLSKKEWIALSEEYDVFINTTHFDNTPVSVMEAMALGMPVVTTNVGGIPFLLNDGQEALLVTDNDAKGMGDAIIRLIEEKGLSDKIIGNARAKAANWDWDTVKVKWDAVLK